MTEEIQQILKKKDYYDILGVSKSFTDDELKKAYRKAALKFHPDKNKNEGAPDAFKKVAQAYDCLSNPDKKRIYDQYGTEKPEIQQTHHHRGHNGYYQYESYAEDDFAQNIFDAFFGQGAFRRPQQNRQNPQINVQLLQFLPIIMLVLLSSSGFLSLFQKAPLYQFQRTYEYNTAKQTRTLQVRYYVGTDFKDEITTNERLKEIELEIERQYVHQLKQECNNVLYKKSMYEQYASRAFYARDRENYKNAIRRLDFSACEKLEEYKNQINGFDYIY